MDLATRSINNFAHYDSLCYPSVYLTDLEYSNVDKEKYQDLLVMHIQSELPDVLNYLSFVDITYFGANSDRPVTICLTPRKGSQYRTLLQEMRGPSYEASAGSHIVFRRGLPQFRERERKENGEGELLFPDTQLDLKKYFAEGEKYEFRHGSILLEIDDTLRANSKKQKESAKPAWNIDVPPLGTLIQNSDKSFKKQWEIYTKLALIMASAIPADFLRCHNVQVSDKYGIRGFLPRF
jgi:hypothetical protein